MKISERMVEKVVTTTHQDGIILELTKNEVDALMAVIGKTGGPYASPIRRVIDPLYEAISANVYDGRAHWCNPMDKHIDYNKTQIVTKL